jgi:hypothetical protein
MPVSTERDDSDGVFPGRRTTLAEATESLDDAPLAHLQRPPGAGESSDGGGF